METGGTGAFLFDMRTGANVPIELTTANFLGDCATI